MSPISTTSNSYGKAQRVEGSYLNQLEYLGAKIKQSHGQVLAQQSQALHDARKCGEFLAKARPVLQKLRANGQCKLNWEKWLRLNAGLSRNTANNYLRIYANFDKLEDLSIEEQSIRAALNYLRTLGNGSSARRNLEIRRVLVKTSDLIAMSERHGVKDIIELEKLVSIVNDVLKIACIRKTVKLEKLSE